MAAEPFAVADDVQAAWRPLTELEETQVTYRLAQASRIIRRRFSTIDDRIAAADLDPDLVADVAIAMVIRYMRNPDGLRQETIEDYSTTRDSTTATGEVCLTDDEIDLLTPISLPSRAFSVSTDPPCSPRRFVRRWP